jgi:Major Facilitator Superfamily
LSAVGERARFGEVFAIREFRTLWLANLLSVAGDQLALVALTILVFDRTHSPLLTAATYAVSFLPWLIGGFTLAGLADRLPRRQVMIACDLARAVLVMVMAAPGMPLWLLVVLLFFITLLDSPFRSARSALIPDILPGDLYVLGTAAMQTTNRSARCLGFALGGIAVGLLGARMALAADALTFAASALLAWGGVRPRPAAADVRGTTVKALAVDGIRLVFGDRQLRTLMLLGWLVPFYAVPEALAVPYATQFHRGAAAAGLVFAAGPFGAMVGSVAFSRWVSPPVRLRWIGPLALCSCAVLVVCVLRPGLAISLAIFAVAGAFSAYQIAANARFVAAVPHSSRGQAFGLANGGIQVGQGLWFIAAGVAAEVAKPTTVVAGSGALGAVAALGLALLWRRHTADGLTAKDQ